MNETFTEKVYAAVVTIPAGKVSTYADVARRAGSPGAFRAVGTAMRNNPYRKIVPCHRVVGSDGRMHGYAFGRGILTKMDLLKSEGVAIVGDRVDLGKSRFQFGD